MWQTDYFLLTHSTVQTLPQLNCVMNRGLSILLEYNPLKINSSKGFPELDDAVEDQLTQGNHQIPIVKFFFNIVKRGWGSQVCRHFVRKTNCQGDILSWIFVRHFVRKTFCQHIFCETFCQEDILSVYFFLVGFCIDKLSGSILTIFLVC